MGRIKTSGSGGGVVSSSGTSGSKSSSGRDSRDVKSETVGSSSSSRSSPGPLSVDVKMKELLKELHQLTHQVQEERSRGEHNLTNISKAHERMQLETRITPYYKTKLKSLYTNAMQDAESEAKLLRKTLEKIAEIKALREIGGGSKKTQIVRRGVLMSSLQQNATTLQLWFGKPGEKLPALCGAIPAEPNHIAKPGDKVAARVKSSGQDGEEDWILAAVVSYNASSCKYEVDDIDAEAGVQRHTLSRRRILPLPIYKANPETDPQALFSKQTLVLALYPQTTCFYRALIYEPPKRHDDDYLVLFEDTSYPDGYSPPLSVPQRYVIACKEEKKK